MQRAGFSLLWLVLIGCVIKVFVQVELGRFTLIVGRTTMDGLNEVPGPRLGGQLDSLVSGSLCLWVSMAPVGRDSCEASGQALAITQPLTAQGVAFNKYQDTETRREVLEALIEHLEVAPVNNSEGVAAKLVVFEKELALLEHTPREIPESHDDVIWAAIISILTAIPPRCRTLWLDPEPVDGPGCDIHSYFGGEPDSSPEPSGLADLTL